MEDHGPRSGRALWPQFVDNGHPVLVDGSAEAIGRICGLALRELADADTAVSVLGNLRPHLLGRALLG